MFSRRQVMAGLGVIGFDISSASCASPTLPERQFSDFETGNEPSAGPAFVRALDWVRREGGGRILLPANRTLLVDQEIRLAANLTLTGDGSCVIRQVKAGQRIFVGNDVSNVTLAGFAVRGTGPQDLFLPERRTESDGEAPRTVTEAGLIHFLSTRSGASSELVIRDLTLSDAFNLLCVRGAGRVHIENCRFSNWMLYGALASGSFDLAVIGNRFEQCAQRRGYTAYAFSATGDERRNFPQRRVRFLRNLVSGIPSWDGFMTHEVEDLVVEDNEFRDVRNGIDITTASGRIANVRVTRNRIFHTRLDTWGGRSAAHFGISVAADPEAPFIQNVNVADNIVSGANSVPGLSSGGYAIGALAFSRIGKLTVSGNLIQHVGNEDSRLSRPKGFDCISIYQPNSEINIVGNSGNGSLDRYFLEINAPREWTAQELTIARNSFNTSEPMTSLIRFAKGNFIKVSISNNQLVSLANKTSEFEIEPGKAAVSMALSVR